MNRVKRVLIYLLALFILSFPAFASVIGTVTDTSGRPVEGALVTFTDESNPDNYFTDYTDETGKYEISITPVFVDNETPAQFMLFQNYPNPFNPTTSITYSLEAAGHVNLSIYNIMGQKVRTLADDFCSAGMHTIVWYGCDDEGKAVAAGIYLYRLTYRDHNESKKMLLLDGGGFSDSYASSINTSSNSVTSAKPAKKAEHTAYCVTITGIDIERYMESSIIVVDGGIYDFTVVRKYNIAFVTIPGGTFEMGDAVGDLWSRCRPVHTVTVSSFEMSVYEITNAQYAAYINSALASGYVEVNGGDLYGKTGDWSGERYLDIGYSYDSSNKCWITYSSGTFIVTSGYENWPVVAVTWYGSKAFAEYYGLELPTEAEWEYACRGGKQYKYGTDDGTINSSKANYEWNVSHLVEVGSYSSNPFGLHEMSGNVWEWCGDWYCLYSSDSQTNPVGPSSGTGRVLRGGGWDFDARFCQSAFRDWGDPFGVCGGSGFRVVRKSGQ